MQGGLELPVEVTVTMENTEKNNVAITKYRDLVTRSYKEPVDGRFEDVTQVLVKATLRSRLRSTKLTTYNVFCLYSLHE